MNDFQIPNNILIKQFLIPLRFLDHAHSHYVSNLIDQLKKSLLYSNEFLTPQKSPAYHIASNVVQLRC